MAEPTTPSSNRRTFGPVVAAGLIGAGLAAMAGTKEWVHADLAAGQPDFGLGTDSTVGQMPLAGALALVVLACWGVVLVTRGRVRRAIAALAALASLGLGATVVVGVIDLRTSVPEAYRRAGVTTHVGTSIEPWVWLAAVGAILTLLASLAAVRFAPAWPEMGRRYDAPGGQEASSAPLEEQSNLDLWTSIGEGNDPTEDETE